MLNCLTAKMREKKGFTLVELIVVLVILGILAALLVPALTGYIDRAREKKIIATTRQVVTAAQTVVSEAYAKAEGKFEEDSLNAFSLSGNNKAIFTHPETPHTPSLLEICELAEIVKNVEFIPNETTGPIRPTGELTNGITFVSVFYNQQGHVTSVILGQNGKYCKYNGADSSYTVTDEWPAN